MTSDEDLRAALRRLEDSTGGSRAHRDLDAVAAYLRLHREVPFFFVKTGESWAGPKPRITEQQRPEAGDRSSLRPCAETIGGAPVNHPDRLFNLAHGSAGQVWRHGATTNRGGPQAHVDRNEVPIQSYRRYVES
jgi:hypothetical protein